MADEFQSLVVNEFDSLTTDEFSNLTVSEFDGLVDEFATIATPLPKQKGFFDTLRNPIDLMYNESVIRQGYNYLTGDTQEVQAKRAKDFIEANPGLMNTPCLLYTSPSPRDS